MSTKQTQRLEQPFQPTVSQVLRSNDPSAGRGLRAAYRQSLFWAIMFGAGEASFGLFANHLGAPTFFYGLLAGIPSLLGPLAQVTAAHLLDKRKKRMALILAPITIQMLCFIPLATIPFWAEPQKPQGAWSTLSPELGVFLGCITLYFITSHLAMPVWNSLISDLIPQEQRGTYFARLTRAPTLVALIVQVSVGIALFYAGRSAEAGMVFAGCFAASFFARAISIGIVRTMEDPPYHASPEAVFTFWQFIRRARESNFVKFVIATTVLHFGAYVAGPYFLPYCTHDLHFEPWQWVAMSAGATISSIVTIVGWGRFSDRFGNKRTMQYCTFLISFVPVGWLLTTDFTALVLVQMVGTVFWTGFSLSSFNYILEAVSPPKRVRCMAYFNILVGVGVFAGSLAGSELIKIMPHEVFGISLRSNFLWVLIFSALIRLAACFYFLPAIRELREVPPFSVGRFLVQVTQVRVIYGLLFGVHGEVEREEEKKNK